jgi:hypothetical protein
MKIYWSWVLAVGCISAQVSAGADGRETAKATPVLVHQSIDGGCELVQRGQYLQYRDYSAVAIDGVAGEIYSLEFAPSDFIQPTDAGGKAPKGAARAGFVVKAPDAGGNSPDLPRVLPVTASNGCPS